MLTGCLDPELNDVPLSTCFENWGQTEKSMIWQLLDSAGAKNKFEPNNAGTPTTPTLIADWTPFLAASDETKPVQTPYLSEPTSEAGAKRVYGGGNATIKGVEIMIGREPTPFAAKMLSAFQDAIKALKTFEVGAGVGVSNLGVNLINSAGQMLFVSNGLDSADLLYELYPIPVHGFFVGDKSLGDLENPSWNALEWQFGPNWSDNLVIITPVDFDALTDLINT